MRNAKEIKIRDICCAFCRGRSKMYWSKRKKLVARTLGDEPLYRETEQAICPKCYSRTSLYLVKDGREGKKKG